MSPSRWGDRRHHDITELDAYIQIRHVTSNILPDRTVRYEDPFASHCSQQPGHVSRPQATVGDYR